MENEQKPLCVLVAPVATVSGYGEHARQIADALIDWGKFDVQIISTRWGVCPPTALNAENAVSKKIIPRLIAQMTKKPDLFVQVSIPNEFQPVGKYNVGITAGIETDLPRGDWIAGLNRMDMNIVPSNFSKEVFVNAKQTIKNQAGQEIPVKMEKPMEVAFEGTDTDVFKKSDAPSVEIDAYLNSIQENFCYLFVGHWLQGSVGADRKNVSMLIKTFFETFKDREDQPALILKTSGGTFSQMDKHDIFSKVEYIKKLVPGKLPNVYLLHGELQPDELNRLYNHPKIKAHVSFTFGEGWGRPLLEATMSGKPVIAPNWSGQTDFLPSDLAILLPGKLEQVHKSSVNDYILSNAKWFAVDYNVASQKLMNVFSHYKPYLDRAEQLRIQNIERFNYKAGNDLLVNILNKYVPGFSVEKPFVLPKFTKV